MDKIAGVAVGCLVVGVVLILELVLQLLVIAGLTYLMCMAFGYEWSWLLSVGVWAIWVFLRSIFKAARSNNNTKER